MADAHAATKASKGYRIYRGRSYARIFAGQLTRIWAEAKRRVASALRQAALTDTDRTRDAITALEGKNHWNHADYARIGVLRAALRAKEDN